LDWGGKDPARADRKKEGFRGEKTKKGKKVCEKKEEEISRDPYRGGCGRGEGTKVLNG